MLISQFARETGLSVDTVRFYVRKGLLNPETTLKGGSKPYQIFRAEHVETARIVRTAQALGFSLKQIADLAHRYGAGAMTPERGAEVMRAQLGELEAKAEQLAGMIAYMRAKVRWIEAGSAGPEPSFGAFACGPAVVAASLPTPPAVGRTRRAVSAAPGKTS